jgi:predicted ester cyclase
MSPEQNRAVAHRFFAEQDRLRGGPADDLCAPGYTARLAGNTLDLAGHKGFAAMFYAAFPDLRHTVEAVAAEEDRAAVRFTLTGTHTGDFVGMPPSGRPITVSATAIMRLAEGRVAELWGEFDQLGLMQQLTAEAVAAGGEESRGI